MPPMESHHPKRLKALSLLNKQHCLQHQPKTIRTTLHAISYTLHAPWSFCSSFLIHHFLVVFQGLSSLCESHYVNSNYQTPCYSIHLHYQIWDIWTFSCLILSQIFPLLKTIKQIRFLSNGIKPSFYSCAINKSNIITRSTKILYLIWSPYICMDKL